MSDTQEVKAKNPRAVSGVVVSDRMEKKHHRQSRASGEASGIRQVRA